MSGSEQALNKEDLQFYVDRRLNRVKAAQVEKYLFENPLIKTELREYQLFNQAFHHMYDAVEQEQIPSRLLKFDQVKPGRGRGERSRFPLAQVAMVLLSVSLGLASGWFLRGELMPEQARQVARDQSVNLVRDAFSNHTVYTPEIRHPVEVSASDKDHLVKWLSKRLKTRIVIPVLDGQGYELLGGRLLSSGNLPAAQFMYQNNKGRRVTLFTRKRRGEEADSAFRYASKGDVNGFYWTDSELSFVLIAEIPKAEMSNLAHVVYEKLNQ